jgi:mannose-6-phosphate isomerase-like protein (cupin superfamily)
MAGSKGLCWARSEIQKLYEGEDYTLELDSHHRFAAGRSTRL